MTEALELAADCSMSRRAKYLERQRYNTSEKGRARQARYEATRIQMRSCGGLISESFHVPAEMKGAIKAHIAARQAELDARQREEYREFAAQLEAEAA